MKNCDKSLQNVLLLGISFFLTNASLGPMNNILQTIIKTIHDEDEYFLVDGFEFLCIVNIISAIYSWVAPPAIRVFGTRPIISLGSITILLYILAYIWPVNFTIYLIACILGSGGGLFGVAEMTYLIANSNRLTISRNAGIYWTFYQLSILLGNTVVYLVFRGYSTIKYTQRVEIIGILSGISASGVGLTFILKKSVKPPLIKDDESTVPPIEPDIGPIAEFLQTLKLLVTKNMILLCTLFFYSGFERRFLGGLLGTTLGFTKLFPKRKALVGLSGIAVATGNCLGVAIFILVMLPRLQYGRKFIVVVGFFLHVIALTVLIVIIPNSAPLGETDDEPLWLTEYNSQFALASAFLLGVGDACFNTQIISMIGVFYDDKSASALCIYKCIQFLGFGVGYSIIFKWYYIIGILVLFLTVGTISILYIDLKEQH